MRALGPERHRPTKGIISNEGSWGESRGRLTQPLASTTNGDISILGLDSWSTRGSQRLLPLLYVH